MNGFIGNKFGFLSIRIVLCAAILCQQLQREHVFRPEQTSQTQLADLSLLLYDMTYPARYRILSLAAMVSWRSTRDVTGPSCYAARRQGIKLNRKAYIHGKPYFMMSEGAMGLNSDAACTATSGLLAIQKSKKKRARNQFYRNQPIEDICDATRGGESG